MEIAIVGLALGAGVGWLALLTMRVRRLERHDAAGALRTLLEDRVAARRAARRAVTPEDGELARAALRVTRSELRDRIRARVQAAREARGA